MKLPSSILLQYETLDNISIFWDVDESLLYTLANGFTLVRHEDHVLFYKVSTNDLSIPEVTTCTAVPVSIIIFE